MKTGIRTIVPGEEYNSLFTRAKGEFVEIKKYAQLQNTVDLMKEVITTTLDDTKALANMLRKKDDYQTCKNVWHFCFSHLQYRRDQEGIEQVRRPIRSWQDRKKGVDCDCMTVFVGSILTNLNIPFVIRLTRYVANEFEHVYPVALIQNNEVIMDCVVHQFDYQVPYKQKKDISMKLQYLNGIGDDEDDGYQSNDEFDQDDDLGDIDLPEDAQALLWMDEDLEGLAGKAKRQEKKAARKEKREDKKEVRQEKKAEKKANKPPLKERIKKVAHVVNRVNPATALLRAGVLASMKLNIGHVAGKLRFSYWSDAQAAQNNMEMGKFAQLKAIRTKLESIFYGAGGKPENLKKSILEGNGNKDKRVSLNGLGAITSPVNDYMSLHSIVGSEIFGDEFSNVQSVNGMGEPISATAAVAAASSAIGIIAGLIKKLGELFKKGSPQAEKEAIEENTAAEDEKTRKFSISNLVTKFAPLAEQIRSASPSEATPTAPTVDYDDEPTAMPSVMSDHAPDLDDYAPIPTGSGSSANLPAEIDDDDDEALPATTASADEIDPTKQEIDEFTPASSAIIPSGNTKSTGEKSGGMMEWVKEHPVITVVGVVTIVAATVAIVRAVKKSKAKGTRRALNGLDGLDGLDGTRRKRQPLAKNRSKNKSTKRRANTPARRKSKPATKGRTHFKRVELK